MSLSNYGLNNQPAAYNQPSVANFGPKSSNGISFDIPYYAGAFVIKTANEWSAQASQRPNPTNLWNGLWMAGEVSCLFADTNVGKSILAVQIAEELSANEKVLYFDFELSDKQFQMRYTDTETGRTRRFNDNFIRVEWSPNYLMGDVEAMIEEIEKVVTYTGAKIVIIDNLTWLCNRYESGDAAGEFMQAIIGMKRVHDLSILVLAHTPKRIAGPLTQNTLAGSKRIANFMDSIFAMGVSRIDRPQGRYIKQIKVRSAAMTNGEDNVIVGRLVKTGDRLFFDAMGTDTERRVLDADTVEKDLAAEQRNQEIRRMLAEGMTYSQIAAELKISYSLISQAKRSLFES